jgi:hypothetical protein
MTPCDLNVTIAVGTLFGTAKYRGQSAGLWSVSGVMTDHPAGISERERSLPSSCCLWVRPVAPAPAAIEMLIAAHIAMKAMEIRAT